MSVLRRFYCDDETGEIVTYSINNETGEPYIDHGTPPIYISHQEYERNYSVTSINLPRGCGYNKKKIKSLEKNIINGSNIVSYRMLLIPTIIVWSALLCALLMILEIYLHVKCHQKNKGLEGTMIYYRSPFHAVTSIFCAICRESKSASRVGQLQDQRRVRYDYLRGAVL